MNVKETPAIKATIKKQKRLFETYELINYAYLHENDLYYSVQFFRFGRPLRFMLLYENGDMVERKLAEHIGFQYIFLNESVLLADKNIRKQKDRKIWMFEENAETMNLLRLDLGKYPEQVQRDVNIYNDMTETIVKGQAHLERLWARVEHVKKVVLQKGYGTDEEVEAMIEIQTEYPGIVYRQGRKMKEAIEPIRRLIQFFTDNRSKVSPENRKKVNRLISLLKANVKRRALYYLNHSQQSFEKDVDGNDIDIPPGEEGIQKVCEESINGNLILAKRNVASSLINR